MSKRILVVEDQDAEPAAMLAPRFPIYAACLDGCGVLGPFSPPKPRPTR